jgi:hypothetical protein
MEFQTVCAVCRDSSALHVGGKCITDPMEDSYDCSDSTLPAEDIAEGGHLHNCARCRSEMVFIHEHTVCVECQEGFFPRHEHDDEEGEIICTEIGSGRLEKFESREESDQLLEELCGPDHASLWLLQTTQNTTECLQECPENMRRNYYYMSCEWEHYCDDVHWNEELQRDICSGEDCLNDPE